MWPSFATLGAIRRAVRGQDKPTNTNNNPISTIPATQEEHTTPPDDEATFFQPVTVQPVTKTAGQRRVSRTSRGTRTTRSYTPPANVGVLPAAPPARGSAEARAFAATPDNEDTQYVALRALALTTAQAEAASRGRASTVAPRSAYSLRAQGAEASYALAVANGDDKAALEMLLADQKAAVERLRRERRGRASPAPGPFVGLGPRFAEREPEDDEEDRSSEGWQVGEYEEIHDNVSSELPIVPQPTSPCLRRVPTYDKFHRLSTSSVDDERVLAWRDDIQSDSSRSTSSEDSESEAPHVTRYNYRTQKGRNRLTLVMRYLSMPVSTTPLHLVFMALGRLRHVVLQAAILNPEFALAAAEIGWEGLTEDLEAMLRSASPPAALVADMSAAVDAPNDDDEDDDDIEEFDHPAPRMRVMLAKFVRQTEHDERTLFGWFSASDADIVEANSYRTEAYQSREEARSHVEDMLDRRARRSTDDPSRMLDFVRARSPLALVQPTETAEMPPVVEVDDDVAAEVEAMMQVIEDEALQEAMRILVQVDL